MSLAELAEQAEGAGGGDASTPPGAEADLAGAEKERAEVAHAKARADHAKHAELLQAQGEIHEMPEGPEKEARQQAHDRESERRERPWIRAPMDPRLPSRTVVMQIEASVWL